MARGGVQASASAGRARACRARAIGCPCALPLPLVARRTGRGVALWREPEGASGAARSTDLTSVPCSQKFLPHGLVNGSINSCACLMNFFVGKSQNAQSVREAVPIVAVLLGTRSAKRSHCGAYRHRTNTSRWPSLIPCPQHRLVCVGGLEDGAVKLRQASASYDSRGSPQSASCAGVLPTHPGSPPVALEQE